ncbi:MAG: hypothetical protein LBV01_05635 [Deltaproteobacteria bacterium]|jgi:hypothetical protein|nr:hypothetical protein [Deltaproteobacteria bacterium]
MRNLFRPPSEALTQDLETALRAVQAVAALAKNHERELPYAVRDLSRLLTQERSDLRRSYWMDKRLLMAYVRYFLPWNLVRLAWLLPDLDLPLAGDGIILDLGSGPLTMPLALWLAKPAWRSLPLTCVCGDIASGPLGLGRDIFAALAGDSPWKIELRRGPLEKTLREFHGRASLITAANVLNEQRTSRETPLSVQLAALTRAVASRLAPGGRFLAVEPGTRLGGKLMALTRFAGFSAWLLPEAPCTHYGDCPMLAGRAAGRTTGQAAGQATGWCHFSHGTGAAPKDLRVLTKQAGLEKRNLNLSCLLLRPATEEERAAVARYLPREDDGGFRDDGIYDAEAYGDDDGDDHDGADLAAALATAFGRMGAERAGAAQPFIRILSDPIRLPDTPEPARYACSERGMALAQNALRMPSGAAVALRWPEEALRDPKSGALVLPLPAAPSARQPEQSGQPGRQFERQPGRQSGQAGQSPQPARTRPGKGRPNAPRTAGRAAGQAAGEKANGAPSGRKGNKHGR